MSSPPAPRHRQKPLPDPTATKSHNFAVEPLETSVRSNRSAYPKSTSTDGTPVRRRFAPLPEESSKKSNRKGADFPLSQEHTNSHVVEERNAIDQSQPATTRRTRFAPQLIETTKRSRKGGETGRALLPSDKTDFLPAAERQSSHQERIFRSSISPLPPVNTPVASLEEISQISESRFSSLVLSRKAPRRHSFRVPDLASIESQPDSEESNNSGCPSLSTSPSATSDETERYKHPTRVRESCDDRFSGYLLALAARAAEKQLREQAMAAYPNENAHEPVDHFAVARESEESENEMCADLLPRESDGSLHGRRQNSALGWEMAEMRLHQDKLEQQRKHYRATEQVELGRLSSFKPCPLDGVGTVSDNKHTNEETNTPRKMVGDWQKGVELRHMRSAASPPMLGDGLVFPKCHSPRQTRMESDQYAYLNKEPGTVISRRHSGLWTPTDTASRRGSAGGLWNGVCLVPAISSLPTPKAVQTGLMTPKTDQDDPFALPNVNSQYQLPPSPDNSQDDSKLAGIDDILFVEEEIEREFNCGFVTQIYNYLSLGYPTLAWKYDEELSKISKVPIEDLRRDDKRVNTKGYIGTPEGSGLIQEDVRDGGCGRWMALQLYVKEWARQQPRMVDHKAGANSDWGVRARKGSWAI
ncbi:hypothetical protein MMC06_003888 [Schaereria dolodes]|nr:hypothetical protein [Schaereria dolodes]